MSRKIPIFPQNMKGIAVRHLATFAIGNNSAVQQLLTCAPRHQLYLARKRFYT
jgi:hypothetical protein